VLGGFPGNSKIAAVPRKIRMPQKLNALRASPYRRMPPAYCLPAVPLAQLAERVAHLNKHPLP